MPFHSIFRFHQIQQPTKVQQLPTVSKGADGCNPQSARMERRAPEVLSHIHTPETSSFHFRWLPKYDQTVSRCIKIKFSKQEEGFTCLTPSIE